MKAIEKPLHATADVLMKAAGIALLAALAVDAQGQRNVTWVGGGGAWEDNNNWIDDDGVPGALQPFSPDAVFIPAGTPVITFLEDFNTLDVDAGAGIANNGVMGVHNGVVNDGTITVADDGQFGIDAGALAGAGQVVLADSIGTNAAISFAPSPNPGSVTHAATHTIRGEGTIQGNYVNNGLIRAEETSGDSTATLAILGTIANNGVIRSSATGGILMQPVTLTMGATGQLIADGQPIVLGTGTIIGGSIDAINGAKLVRRDAGGTAWFSGVTINGDFDVLVTNAGIGGFGAGITNNGTITLDNLGVANGQFHMDAGSTLDGTGQLVLNRQNDNVHVTGSFTHGANHTIRGAGRIRANIVNNGSILAEPKTGGGLLRIVGNAITNNNLLQANDGATMRVEGTIVTQGAAGRIRAADGGRVELQGFATVNGGKLQTAGTGVIVDANASVLSNVTNEGEFHVLAGSTTRVNTTLVNNGTITVNPSGVAIATAIEFTNDAVLSGTGTIVLNQTFNNARITSAQSNQDITQAAGHTIRGPGRISSGFFGDGRFINHGRLEGASAAQPLLIQAQLSGSGALKDVQLGGDAFGISHTLADAGTTAIVPVEGSYNFLGFNRMLVDLAGTSPGAGYDQLNSTGPITLSNVATRLEVSLAGGFVPAPGDTFSVVTTTDTLTGTFGAVILPGHVPNFSIAWKPALYTSNSLILEVLSVTEFAGDYNADGKVDAGDYTVWRDTLGSTTNLAADGSGNGVIDSADHGVWAANYGATAPATALAVPEPAALLTHALLLLLLPTRRGP